MEILAEYWVLVISVLFAGFAAGFAGGLFGIGGGIIIVPVLYGIFKNLGIDTEVSLKTGIGTSLAVIIVTSLRSLSAHYKQGHVDWSVLKSWGPWIAVGAAIGGLAAKWAPVEALTIVFVAGALFIALQRMKDRNKPRVAMDLHRKRIKIFVGAGTGLFSAIMGLGGGALGVMVMTASGRAIHQAVATSAGFGFVIAVPGLAGFIWSGHLITGLPPGSLGYFNLPAFCAMAAMAAIAAPMGARLAHKIQGDLLSKLFAGYVFVAAIGLFVDVFF